MLRRFVDRGVGRGGKHIQILKKYVKMFVKVKIIFSPINIKTDKRNSRCYLKISTVKIIILFEISYFVRL